MSDHNSTPDSRPSAIAIGGQFSMIEKLTLWRCSVGELVELGDNAANDGNNDDALRQYYAALEKERHSAPESVILSVITNPHFPQNNSPVL